VAAERSEGGELYVAYGVRTVFVRCSYGAAYGVAYGARSVRPATCGSTYVFGFLYIQIQGPCMDTEFPTCIQGHSTGPPVVVVGC